MVRARPENGEPRLYLLDLDGRTTRPVTPEGLAVGLAGWVVSPDGTMVAVSAGQRLQLIPTAGGPARGVPEASDRWSVLGWIEGALLVSEDPVAGGTVLRVDPATGRRDTWANIQPQDPARS